MALIARNRVAFAALFLFILSTMVPLNLEPWLFHSIQCLIYAPLAILIGRPVSSAALFIITHQYFMAWNGFLFPADETIFYSTYFALSLMLNVALILSLGKTGRGYAGHFSAYHDSGTHRLPGL